MSSHKLPIHLFHVGIFVKCSLFVGNWHMMHAFMYGSSVGVGVVEVSNLPGCDSVKHASIAPLALEVPS